MTLLRIPTVLADYGCGRSGVCCNMAWKVPVTTADEAVVHNRLVQLGADDMLTEWKAAIIDRRGHRLLRQPDGKCTLLTDGPTCRLHVVTGLEGLPSACRNFPRSVVATPDGIEVAFTLGCPTAAGMVARRALRFTWQERSAEGWAYPPMGTCRRRIPWTRLADVDYPELCARRQAWWDAIDEARDDVAGPLAALLEAPGEPALKPSGQISLAVDLGEQDLKAATLMLMHRRMPRGERYRDIKRALWRGLSAAHDDAAVRSGLARISPMMASALALYVQHAGVHVHRPATETLLLAARRMLAAGAIARVLLDVGGVEPVEATADALTAAARLTGAGRWHHPTGLELGAGAA